MIWSPAMIGVARSCRRQWGLKYGTIVATMPRRNAGNASLKPLPARMGTLAHIGMEAAYLAARNALMTLAGTRMDAYEDNALSSMKGAALELDLDEQDLFEVQSDVLHTLRKLPAPLPGAVFGVERDLEALLPSGRMMRGRADLLLRTGRRTIHIRDWKRKRAKTLPRPDDLLSDDALGFYAYSLYRQYPDYQVTVGLYSLRDQIEVSREFPIGVAWSRAHSFDALIDSIEADEVLRPTPRGGNCMSCAFVTVCPEGSRSTS